LAKSLIGEAAGICLFDRALQPRGQTPDLKMPAVTRWVKSLGWVEATARSPETTSLARGQWLSAIPLEQDGSLLGVFCIQQERKEPPARPSQHAAELQRALKPLLDCVHREMVGALPVKSRLQTLTERTAELEWLFKVTSNLKGSTDEKLVLQELLDSAAARLESALGVLYIPGKRLCLERAQSPKHAAQLLEAWRKTKQHLLAWAQRHNRPLILGGQRSKQPKASMRILGVPVVRDSGQVIGVLGFFNPASAPEFASRHIFMARHLGRQAASIVESQFDLMTGLYTRGGLEQASGQSSGELADNSSILYIDVDHMHVVNELHGFELGNELIVRIADLLGPPLLPEGAIAARISADRFAILLPLTDVQQSARAAEAIREAASRLKLGPAESTFDVSISCGVASYIAMPQGLDRALAMAELACKAAKAKGRNRVEIYASTDNSMIRRHGDVLAVGQLRAALKADRLVLYAQRIVPLRSLTLPGGYEILVRLLDDDDGLVLPGPLISAAQRYQLLPSLDRWVTTRALEMLAPYRSMLSSRGVNMSLNVSGQSICDETFVTQLAQQIKVARLPQDCITVEITEQSAVTNLARANELIRQLKVLGCQIALDDFGTGANSLTYLKHLQISRVKIDGSFVRDVATDRNSRSTVRAIVELAAGMSIDTVAEFVETKEIADEVRELGVDYAQGYAFGKPEPLHEVLKALGDEESRRLHRLFLES
jgi:diguanylate cyclase (GGDEF)-like protein